MPSLGSRKLVCKNGHRRTDKDLAGRVGQCTFCRREREKRYRTGATRERYLAAHRNQMRDARRRSPEKFATIVRKALYKVDVEKYNAMLQEQDNTCAICGVAFGKDRRNVPHIDHNHSCCSGSKSCGKCVRGLLCTNCNKVLGYMKDDVNLLNRAIKYLERTQVA